MLLLDDRPPPAHNESEGEEGARRVERVRCGNLAVASVLWTFEHHVLCLMQRHRGQMTRGIEPKCLGWFLAVFTHRGFDPALRNLTRSQMPLDEGRKVAVARY